MRLILSAAALALILGGCSVDANEPSGQTFTDRAATPKQVNDPYYVRAADAVKSRLNEDSAPKAKNVILFVGDGMGISTITAARIYAGQARGLDGESYKLTMEQMPYSALSRTYSHDYQVSDSASTATAMVSGVKTRSRVLGLTSEVAVGNCASAAGIGTDTLFELAERQGLATGIVSTARITHATPGSTYAKSAHRNWEDDTSFGENADGGCKDIARQLIEWPEGDGFELALGGGARHFLPRLAEGEEGPSGRRADGRDLTAEWQTMDGDRAVVFDKAGFDVIDFDSDVRVLGLFQSSHMQYELDRLADEAGDPSLAELTEAAITRLSRSESGYVLMIEAGRIDHAHHGVNAARALADTDALDMAVAKALSMTDASETLIIVTADHSHTMTMAGYPRRNNPILGKVQYETGVVARGDDGLPYTTLGYINGQSACRPSQVEGEDGFDCTRQDLTDIDTTAKDFRQPALVFMGSETHAGEDVAIFASGPGAELVRGVMDQNEIFHVMGYASGLVSTE